MYKFAALLVACARRADGHGAMVWPPARNGGATGANGRGVCGNGGQWPVSSDAELLDGSYTVQPFTQLQAGGTVEVKIGFTAQHQGHFVVELCANPGSRITQDCFVRLMRDPSDTYWGPYSPAHPDYFILPDNSCLSGRDLGRPITARFQIPSNMATNHGILRWYWQTGNSCGSCPETNGQDPTISAWTANIESRQCRVAIFPWQSCGTDCPNPSCPDEQFTNCADVTVTGGSGGAPPPTSAPVTTTAPPSSSCSGCTCLKDTQNTGQWCQDTCQNDASMASYCNSIGMGSDIPGCMVKTYPTNCSSSGGSAPPPPPPNENTTSTAAPGGGNGGATSCTSVTSGIPVYIGWCQSTCLTVCASAADKQKCMSDYAPVHCAA